jgi:hypothetical protein
MQLEGSHKVPCLVTIFGKFLNLFGHHSIFVVWMFFVLEPGLGLNHVFSKVVIIGLADGYLLPLLKSIVVESGVRNNGMNFRQDLFFAIWLACIAGKHSTLFDVCHNCLKCC